MKMKSLCVLLKMKPPKGFNVLMLNVRSLFSTVDELDTRFNGCDVIALCQTWLNDGHTDEMLNLGKKKKKCIAQFR